MDFEKKVLKGMLHNEDIVKNADRSNLKRKYFDTKLYGKLFDIILDVYEKEDVTKDSILTAIEADDSFANEKGLEREDKDECINIVQNLYEENYDGAVISLEKLNKKAKKKEFLKNCGSSVDKIEQGKDIDEIIQDHTSRLNHLQGKEENYEVYDYYEDHVNRKKERLKEVQDDDDSKVSLKFGLHLDVFEEYFERGFRAGDLIALMANTGRGKSTLATNFIYLATHPFNGLDVLYIFGENSRTLTGNRLDQIFLNVKRDELFEAPIEQDLGGNFFENAKEKGFGSLHCCKFVPNNFTASGIRDVVDRVNQKDGVDIDLLVVDAPDNIEPKGTQTDYFLRKEQPWRELESISDQKEVIVIAPLPLKAKAANKDNLTMEYAAGSYGISKLVDVGIALSADEDDKLVDRVRLDILKNRIEGKLNEDNIFLRFHDSLRMISQDADDDYHEQAVGKAEKEEDRKEQLRKEYKINKQKGGNEKEEEGESKKSFHSS